VAATTTGRVSGWSSRGAGFRRPGVLGVGGSADAVVGVIVEDEAERDVG